MGGKGKAMICIASLVDKEGKIIKDQKVPIHLTLRYDNEQRTVVAKQDIFRTVGASCHGLYIDPETGTASLQFRIDDVSKNHQGQNFIIEISADKEKYPDVAPVYSRSVRIRSKKQIKRQRDDASAPILPAPKHQATQQKKLSSQPSPPSSSSAESHPFVVLGSSQSTQQICQAMRGVIKWTEEALNALGPLKWNVIGHEQNSDGVIDYNRPYHSIPNPNERINQILNMYTADTRDHLQVLLDAVEQSTGAAPTNTEMSYANHPSSHSATHPSTSHVQTPFHPDTRPWKNTYQDHPSYNTEGLAFHESSALSPPQVGQATMPNHGAGPSMPYLQPVPMQKQHWMQHNTQGIYLPHQIVSMSRDPDHTNQWEPGMTGMSIDLAENRQQADVQYVFAKVFTSLRTDKRLGFPAYSITKELLGFYREPSRGSGSGSGQFVTIHKYNDEFDQHNGMDKASRLLKEAILKRSPAVYALKDWESLSIMVEHALLWPTLGSVIGSPAQEYLMF